MERINKPTLLEILDALANEDTPRDWDIQVMERANKKDIEFVQTLLEKGMLAKEARQELDYMEVE